MYEGPLHDEPPAVELHNTVFATAGGAVDGLVDRAGAEDWLRALAARAGTDPALAAAVADAEPPLERLLALRGHVRAALADVLDGRPHDPATLAALNVSSVAAARAPQAVARPGAPPERTWAFPAAAPGDVVLGLLAADAIALLTGPDRDRLRRCGAPGCVLAYLRDHPRRAWCSNACGNRARQARHYARTRGR